MKTQRFPDGPSNPLCRFAYSPVGPLLPKDKKACRMRCAVGKKARTGVLDALAPQKVTKGSARPRTLSAYPEAVSLLLSYTHSPHFPREGVLCPAVPPRTAIARYTFF